MEYAIDPEEWFPFSCQDGILDSSIESFRLELSVDAWPDQVFVRVTDESENVSTGSAAHLQDQNKSNGSKRKEN
jgi:hypothetical protein